MKNATVTHMQKWRGARPGFFSQFFFSKRLEVFHDFARKHGKLRVAHKKQIRDNLGSEGGRRGDGGMGKLKGEGGRTKERKRSSRNIIFPFGPPLKKIFKRRGKSAIAAKTLFGD